MQSVHQGYAGRVHAGVGHWEGNACARDACRVCKAGVHAESVCTYGYVPGSCELDYVHTGTRSAHVHWTAN